MLVSKLQTNIQQTNVYNNHQSKPFTKMTKLCDTNPLSSDTFKPSVSFKAAIHDCARHGFLEGVQQELAHGVNVNSQDEAGDTALIEASCNGHTAIAIELLKQPNIDVNIQNRYRNTALIWACKNGFTEIVKELLKNPNIDVNIQGENRLTALILASKNGRTEIAKELLKNPDIDVNIQNEYGDNALMWACNWDYTEIVRELLKHPNIDINIKNNAEMTALDLAKEKKYTVIVKMLEDYVPGVDRREGLMTGVYVKKPPVDITKLSPEENIWTKEEISTEFLRLVGARKYDDAIGMLKITPLIDLDGDENEILTKVCGTSNPKFAKEVFDYLFHKQAQLQVEYDSKRKEFLENTIKTLGYNELKNNNIALNTIDGFRVLMNTEKFNPNGVADTITLFERACRIDPEGNLAKEILAKHGDVITVNAARTTNKVIKDLIENYEKVGKYRTVLNKIENNAFYADERRGVAANQLKALLESPNFTPEIADEVGNSVLHIAAALPDDMGRTLIQMALDKGVDINAGNCTNQRPLMSAIKKLITTDDNAGKMNLMANIKFLLDKGADINAQDNNGQTAFHFACMSTVGALLTLLLSKNPNVFLPDKYGNRACVYLKTPEMKEIYKEYVTRSLL